MHKIHINIDSFRIDRNVRPNICPFYSQNCLHIFGKVLRSTPQKPTLGVGSIRCVDPKALDHLKSPNFNLITNMKSFDFSTLYTTIPYQKRKKQMNNFNKKFIHSQKRKSEIQIFIYMSRGTLFCKGTM